MQIVYLFKYEKKVNGLADIKIYVASHKDTFVPAHPFFVPLQIGTALHAPLEKFLHDNSGDHISAKNGSYCELTGQYWAWKNQNADYYGFYHYRRYLSFQPEKHPYVIRDYPDEATLQKMGYQLEAMEQFIMQYDIIVPMAENMYETVWDNYRRAPYHYVEDLQRVVDLVCRNHPDYKDDAERYLNGTKLYLKNMYIMKRELFQQYCSWLFPLLEQFDQCNDWNKYQNKPAAMRVNGYLAERLFGIWYTHLQRTQTIKSCELSRVHFASMDGGKGTLHNMKLVNSLLPPGTRRRSMVSRAARFALRQVRK